MTATHYRILASLWTALILVAYSIPTPSVSPDTALQLDKIAHFGLFLGFGFLWMHALHPRRPPHERKAASWRRTLMLLGVGLGLSVLAEFYQELLPRRTAEPYDAVANLLGLLAAVGVFWWRHPPSPHDRRGSDETLPHSASKRRS